MRKKVDERIRTLIENGAKLNHRSMFVMIGDKSRDQMANLHQMVVNSALSDKSAERSARKVLWCYREKLELSSHKKKRAKQIKKLTQRGLLDLEKADSFSLFVESGLITHCLYKDSERILGNTFKMCILQDFEALTPNLLARTIETVRGGGLIVLLLRSLSSLTSLYTMVMDVHERFRTESHSVATGRFNERFLLSIASCKACVVMDDELNILPISSHIRSIMPVSIEKDSDGCSEMERNLKNLKEQLYDDFPIGPLIGRCRTLDQGKAVVTFLDAILDKSLRSTVALLAGRGRGKSAALGLAIAGSVAAGYSNIFVTAPSPENLKTLFEFVCLGFQALEYNEHIDYDVAQSANPDFKKTTVRINIFKQHRQTIQYIHPHEHDKLSQVELLVVDEAAAIPLSTVKSLIGPYLVFLSSTVNGYEGTGRSLSLKLLQQLEQQSHISTKNADNMALGRSYTKIELSESIRYGSGDPIEAWLHELLCLDVVNSIPHINRLPSPNDCELYYVNRDTLFSYHKDSELFFQRMMALFVASHYKNSPNDLQLLADAPAHHLFVLLGPVDESKNQLPDILCVMQVCLEGKISSDSAKNSLREGRQPFGDQIPWKFCEQFRDTDFPSLSGARIVRIAAHPSAMRLGYGSTAVQLLSKYYEGGQLTPISEMDLEGIVETQPVKVIEAAEKASLLEETIKPKEDLPHLLQHLRERVPEKLHYIGVSFGLTLDLFRFWKKQKFAPFYIGQNPSVVTGEHTCMALKPLKTDDIEVIESDEWGFFSPFYQEFRKKFLNLLTSSFCDMEYNLALSILAPKINFETSEPASSAANGLLTLLDQILPPRFMERLESYTNNVADVLSIRDFELDLARQYFHEKLQVTLKYDQVSVLLCICVQHKSISCVENEMGKLNRSQIMSKFRKVMKKFHTYLNGLASSGYKSTLPPLGKIVFEPHGTIDTEDAELDADDMKAQIDDELNTELQQYAIVSRETDFESASLKGSEKKIPSGSRLISVKSSKMKKHEKHVRKCEKRSRDQHISKSNKKRKS